MTQAGMKQIHMLIKNFLVNWPFPSGEELQNRFSRWQPSWISDRTNFSHFYLQVTQILPTKFRINWPKVQPEVATFSANITWLNTCPAEPEYILHLQTV